MRQSAEEGSRLMVKESQEPISPPSRGGMMSTLKDLLPLLKEGPGRHKQSVITLSAVVAAAVTLLILLSVTHTSNLVVISSIERQVAEPPRTKAHASVIILVTSCAASTGRREILRRQFVRNFRLIEKKFGRNAAQSVVVRYMIGNDIVGPEIVREDEQWHDVLFLDVPDCDPDGDLNGRPSATTLKVMHGITWAVDHYDFDYVVRLGDDAYFRIDYFMERIAQGAYSKKKLLLGWIRRQIPLGGMVLDYPQGMGFVLTFDLCEWIAVSTKMDMLMDTWPEDGMVGRWLLGTKANWTSDGEGFREYEWGWLGEKSILIHKLPREAWNKIDDQGVLTVGAPNAT